MAASKIAPTLARVVLPRFRYSQERYLSDEDAPVAARELRALLRVARAAERDRVERHAAFPEMRADPKSPWAELDRALDALARASGARSRKGER